MPPALADESRVYGPRYRGLVWLLRRRLRRLRRLGSRLPLLLRLASVLSAQHDLPLELPDQVQCTLSGADRARQSASLLASRIDALGCSKGSVTHAEAAVVALELAVVEQLAYVVGMAAISVAVA
jgi:hypothetical protein